MIENETTFITYGEPPPYVYENNNKLYYTNNTWSYKSEKKVFTLFDILLYTFALIGVLNVLFLTAFLISMP